MQLKVSNIQTFKLSFSNFQLSNFKTFKVSNKLQRGRKQLSRIRSPQMSENRSQMSCRALATPDRSYPALLSWVVRSRRSENGHNSSKQTIRDPNFTGRIPRYCINLLYGPQLVSFLHFLEGSRPPRSPAAKTRPPLCRVAVLWRGSLVTMRG